MLKILFLKLRKNIVFWIFAAFSLGIVLNEEVRPCVWVGFCGAVCSMAALSFCRHYAKFVFIALLSFVFLGMLYCRAASCFPKDHIYYAVKSIDRKQTAFIGQVISDVKKVKALGGYRSFEFLLKWMQRQDGQERAVQGKVLVRSFLDVNIKPGDVLEIRGTIHRPFDFSSGNFSYQEYLQRRRIYLMISVGKKGVVRILETDKGFYVMVRERIKFIFDQYLPGFDAGILKAVIVGDRSGIGQRAREVFANTGTAHILAISGLHMGIILMIFLLVLGFFPLSQNVKFVMAIVLLGVYLPIAGGRVSVLRSGIMSALFLYSFILERRLCSLNALGVAGLIILMINPLDLYTIGFQLSFSAVASLIVFYGDAQNICRKLFHRFHGVITQALSASLCAWLGVVGWIIYYFGLFVPVGIIANVVIVMLMPLLIAAGLLLVIVGLLQFQWLASIFAVNIQIVLRMMVYVVCVAEKIPFGHVSGIEITARECGLYYSVLVAMVVLKILKKPPKIRRLF